MYLQAKLIFRVFNQLVFIFFPLSMFVGFVLNVSLSFMCIKMFHQLPTMIVYTLLFINLFIAILTVLFHTAAMIITEEYVLVDAYRKGRVVTRHHLALYAGCQIVRVKIGSFFLLQKTTLLNTVIGMAIVDNVVNLLLIE